MDENEKKARRHLKQTTLMWIERLLPSCDGIFMCPILPLMPRLLPVVFATLDDPEADIAEYARSCCEWVANVPLIPEVGYSGASPCLDCAQVVMPDVLRSLESVANAKSWHVRASVPTFIAVMLFRHQFIFEHSRITEVLELCLRLLKDSRLEVRGGAPLRLTPSCRSAKTRGSACRHCCGCALRRRRTNC